MTRGGVALAEWSGIAPGFRRYRTVKRHPKLKVKTLKPCAPQKVRSSAALHVNAIVIENYVNE